MKSSTEKALDRAMEALDRAARPRRRTSLRAPLYLATGMIVAYQLLVRLLPRVWAEALPGGLEQASQLSGVPGTAFRLAYWAFHHFPAVTALIGVTTLAALMITRLGWAGRLIVWLAALTVVATDAALLALILSTAVRLSASAVGIGL